MKSKTTTKDSSTYRFLPHTFRDKGYEFHQEKRTDSWAVYKQQRVDNGKVVAYEVVRIQRFPETRFPDGSVSPPREAYPRSESWGTDGWTFRTLEAATQWVLTHTAEEWYEDSLPVS